MKVRDPLLRIWLWVQRKAFKCREKWQHKYTEPEGVGKAMSEASRGRDWNYTCVQYRSFTMNFHSRICEVPDSKESIGSLRLGAEVPGDICIFPSTLVF